MTMPRFYLNLTRGNDKLPNDHEPQEFLNLEAARIEAVESLRELCDLASREETPFNYDGIDIVSQDGRLLLRVLSSEVTELAKLSRP
jgi:hypothetical protein